MTTDLRSDAVPGVLDILPAFTRPAALVALNYFLSEKQATGGAREGVEEAPPAGNSRLLLTAEGAFSVTHLSANNPQPSEELPVLRRLGSECTRRVL